MEGPKLGAKEAACAILERLALQLSDATVDYECAAGVHHFMITYAGTRFRVQFAEQVLLRKSEVTVSKVVERVLCSTGPGSVKRPML
jgi:hypothetical protein